MTNDILKNVIRSIIVLFYFYLLIMVLSKGLVISLGFSALSCTLLFLYFRNKFSTMERKVNVMFDLVQNYQPSEQYSMENMHSENQSYENSNEEQNNGAGNENAVSEGELDNRIVVLVKLKMMMIAKRLVIVIVRMTKKYPNYI